MDHDQGTQPTSGTAVLEMRDGDDFGCPNCGCEIMLKHHGDELKMQNMRPFTCCCGTPMQPEHRAGRG